MVATIMSHITVSLGHSCRRIMLIGPTVGSDRPACTLMFLSECRNMPYLGARIGWPYELKYLLVSQVYKRGCPYQWFPSRVCRLMYLGALYRRSNKCAVSSHVKVYAGCV